MKWNSQPTRHREWYKPRNINTQTQYPSVHPSTIRYSLGLAATCGRRLFWIQFCIVVGGIAHFEGANSLAATPNWSKAIPFSSCGKWQAAERQHTTPLFGSFIYHPIEQPCNGVSAWCRHLHRQHPVIIMQLCNHRAWSVIIFIISYLHYRKYWDLASSSDCAMSMLIYQVRITCTSKVCRGGQL